jgi:hypothetical protein
MYVGSIERPAGTVRGVVLHLFAFVVEAILVFGLVLLILAPSTDGGQRGGPDRPLAPLTSPVQP